MFVYIIAAGDMAHKIGIATEPWKRIRELQVGNPVKLNILFCAEVDTEDRARRIELRAHQDLGPHRLEGEWFNVDGAAAYAAVTQVIDQLLVRKPSEFDKLRWRVEALERRLGPGPEPDDDL